ncbi:MAG: response regulator transcription factor [Lachnospiraceae bacterium]|jgi:DNA-binding response OmpR family regulator|nr:response regulator transcription factor [Lachnospiraceae bacterium]
MSGKILIVDDEKLIVKGLKLSLEQDGMECDAAYDGEEALSKIKSGDYDVVLLDVMLPKLSGIEVCKAVREFSKVPVIMVTAKGEDDDKIEGLETGADDYVTKPFNLLELKARIRAVLRRSARDDEDKKAPLEEEPSIRLDNQGKRIFIGVREYDLTAKEYEILKILVNNPDTVYGREKLLHLVWGESYVGDARTVDVHVRRLREKIEENPSDPQIVRTKWGVGYYFKG